MQILKYNLSPGDLDSALCDIKHPMRNLQGEWFQNSAETGLIKPRMNLTSLSLCVFDNLHSSTT
jgi:hypothetical protein